MEFTSECNSMIGYSLKRQCCSLVGPKSLWQISEMWALNTRALSYLPGSKCDRGGSWQHNSCHIFVFPITSIFPSILFTIFLFSSSLVVYSLHCHLPIFCFTFSVYTYCIVHTSHLSCLLLQVVSFLFMFTFFYTVYFSPHLLNTFFFTFYWASLRNFFGPHFHPFLLFAFPFSVCFFLSVCLKILFCSSS